MRYRLLILALMMMGFAHDRAWASGARFEPADGKVLLFVGQNLEDFQAYLDTAQVVPGGMMAYTSVNKGEGLDHAFNEGDGTQFAQKLVDAHPDTALQLGLWMVDDCAAIAHGDWDAAIDRLGAWIQKTNRPVFLRVGYEFDGPQNHYPPQDYVQAFRHLVDRFRKQSIHNVAYVWHSYASTISQPLSDWFPGDEYVDWVGISYFNQPQHLMQPALDFAAQHAKPVMICESSPWVVQTKYANAWNLWFVPLFKFIQTNHIKALCYINCDWDAMQQFQDQHWGETRLQANAEILRRWLAETAQGRYLKSSPDLYRFLGYNSAAQ